MTKTTDSHTLASLADTCMKANVLILEYMAKQTWDEIPSNVRNFVE